MKPELNNLINSREVDLFLGTLVKGGFGSTWNNEYFNRATFQLKCHYILTQVLYYIFRPSVYAAAKELIESELMERERIMLAEHLGGQCGVMDNELGMVKYLPNNGK